MSFILIRSIELLDQSRKEREILTNPDKIESLYATNCPADYKKKGGVYEIHGIHDTGQIIIMNLSQFSDLQEKLRIKIPIN